MARLGTGALAGTGLVFLGIGFGLGTWMAGTGAGPAPVERGIVARQAPVRERPSEPQAPAATTPASAAPDSASLHAVRGALAALPAVAVPTGTGVIKGRVQKEDGQPLPGVEVTLQPEPPKGTFPSWIPGRDPEPDLETQIATLMGRTRWQKEARKIATTDAVGEFAFDGLFETNHSIVPRLKGWQISSRSNDAYRARPGADLQYRATPVVEVAVEVALPDGSAPPQATVKFGAGSGWAGHGWSPENPTIQLKPGTYQAAAFTGEWNREDLRSDEQTVTLSADAPAPALRFALRGRPGIRGRLVFEGFTMEGGLQVRGARVPADGKPDPALLQGSPPLNTWANPHDGFVFTFPDLAPGRYVFGVLISHRGKPVAWETAEVAGDLVTKDLRISRLDPEEFLVVRVAGPDGAMMTAAQFGMGYRVGSGSSSMGGSTALRRNDGAFLVPHVDIGPAKIPEDAVWWVEATAAGLGTKRAEYRKGQVQEVLLRFEEPGVVEIAMTGYRGSPLEGALQFSIQPQEPSGGDGRMRRSHFSGQQQRFDAEGRATVPGVQPGEYEVVTFTGNNPMKALSRTPVTVRSGKNAASVPVPAVHSVTVLGVEGSAYLQKTGDPYWADGKQADSEGRVVYELLPEGEYSVRSGQKKQEFRLPGTAEVRL